MSDTQEQAKHTPGPWRTDGFHGRIEKITPQEDSGVCVAVMPMWEAEYEAEKNANARLIAAAPEMLEALRQTELQLEYLNAKFIETGTTNQLLAQVRAVIAKAEGRS